MLACLALISLCLPTLVSMLSPDHQWFVAPVLSGQAVGARENPYEPWGVPQRSSAELEERTSETQLPLFANRAPEAREGRPVSQRHTQPESQEVGALSPISSSECIFRGTTGWSALVLAAGMLSCVLPIVSSLGLCTPPTLLLFSTVRPEPPFKNLSHTMRPPAKYSALAVRSMGDLPLPPPQRWLVPKHTSPGLCVCWSPASPDNCLAQFSRGWGFALNVTSSERASLILHLEDCPVSLSLFLD